MARAVRDPVFCFNEISTLAGSFNALLKSVRMVPDNGLFSNRCAV